MVVYTGKSFPQSQFDSLFYSYPVQPVNRLFTNFDKQLNTYYLNAGFDYFGSIPRFQFNVNQNFRSTLVKTGTNSIRDEQHLLMSGKYSLINQLKPGLDVKSNILSDDRSFGINQTAVNQASAFSELQIADNLVIKPYGGYSNNKQVGEEDNGPLYGIEGTAKSLYLQDLYLSSKLKFENEDISPRKNTIRLFNLSVNNLFNPYVENLVGSGYNQSRKDFYFVADSITSSQFNVTNNIESRTESIYFILDKLNYNRFLDIFSLEIFGRLNWRDIDRDTRYRSTDVQSGSIFDTDIEELSIALESSVYYKIESIDAAIRLNYLERDEKHVTKRFAGIDESFYEQRSEAESRKNNNSGRIILSLFGNVYLSRFDRLGLSFYHSKLKYDTPNTENDDDRDEILSIIRLRYTRFISPFFEAFVNAEATSSHIVYLFASRSANNYRNRVLRLATGGHYRGAVISSKNNFEVSANYTVYDFEDLTSSLRSISFRQFTATDSTQWKLTNKFSFLLNAYVTLTDQGDLNWDEFAERPTRYLREILLDPKFGLTFDAVFLAIGIRYFSLETFNYQGLTRIPDTDFSSIGPLTEIIIGSASLHLRLLGWYEFISANDVPDTERTNLLAEVNWKF